MSQGHFKWKENVTGPPESQATSLWSLRPHGPRESSHCARPAAVRRHLLWTGSGPPDTVPACHLRCPPRSSRGVPVRCLSPACSTGLAVYWEFPRHTSIHTQNESAPLRGRSWGSTPSSARSRPEREAREALARAPGRRPSVLGACVACREGDRQSGLQVLVAAGSASVPRPACSPRRAPFPEAPACGGWGCRAAGQSDLGPLATAAPVAIPSLKRHVPVGRAAGPAGPPCPERRPGSEEPGTRPPRPAQSKASHPAPRHDAAPHSRLHPHRPHHTPCQRSARTGSSLQVAGASTPTNASPAE